MQKSGVSARIFPVVPSVLRNEGTSFLFAREQVRVVLYCSYCGRPSDVEGTGRLCGFGWCYACRRVFPIPLFKIPGSTLGVLTVLGLRLLL